MGVVLTTGEKIIVDKDGVYAVSSVQRLPKEQRFDAELLKSIASLPWQHKPEVGTIGETRLPEPIYLEPAHPEVACEPTAVFEPVDTAGKKAVHLRKGDLIKHGYTAGCAACDAHKLGISVAGREHTVQCRTRVSEALRTDPITAARVQAAYTRNTEFIARELERADKKRKVAEETPVPEGDVPMAGESIIQWKPSNLRGETIGSPNTSGG